MARLAVYDSDEVHVIIGGFPITDLRAETFISVTQRNDRYTEDEGADGGVVRNATHSRLYDISLTLLGGSSENTALSVILLADSIQPNATGIVSFLLQDNNGDTVLTTDKCWIKKQPDVEFGMQRGDVTWELVAVIDPTTSLVGGNG